MGPRQKNWCQTVVLKAIRVAVPAFQHSCTCTAHKALKIRGSRVDEYCTAKNGTRTATTLIPDQYYSICYRMKTQVIDKLLPAEAVITAGNNNTNTAAVRPEPPGRPDPPGGVGVTAANINSDPPGVVVGGIMLPRVTLANIKQETSLAAAEIAMGND